MLVEKWQDPVYPVESDVSKTGDVVVELLSHVGLCGTEYGL